MADWKSVLATVAPVLGTAIGGPLGTLAGRVVGEVLLGEGEHSQDDIAQALEKATPQQLMQLKQADNQFKRDMKELDVKIEKIHSGDRKSARDLAKANMWPQIMLSGIFVAGYFVLLYMIFSGHLILDESIRDMANILIGVMTANIPSIMQFWFGSSTGSKAKAAHIQNGHK